MTSDNQATPKLKQPSLTVRFVQALRKLDAKDDRGAMAELRSGLKSRNGFALPMTAFVAPFLGEHESYRDQWFYVVAALFALHPQPGGKGSMGTALAQLRDDSGSMEKRFQLLLSCDSEDLFGHLYQTVSLLASSNVPVDWATLLADLVYHRQGSERRSHQPWDDPDQTIQMRWARNFYHTYVPEDDSKQFAEAD